MAAIRVIVVVLLIEFAPLLILVPLSADLAEDSAPWEPSSREVIAAVATGYSILVSASAVVLALASSVGRWPVIRARTVALSLIKFSVVNLILSTASAAITWWLVQNGYVSSPWRVPLGSG